MTHAIDPEYLQILERHDTPTVCNAIELFDVRPRSWGFLGGEIKALFPELPPIVGYASTATFRSAHPLESGEAYSNLGAQVERMERELPRPRIVVFQDLDEKPCGATFGEVMCTTYLAFGCVGIVTSGGGRDLEQLRARKFPCFAASVIPSHAYCRIVDLHVPVTVGGVLVRPGDLLHADANGVTTIPNRLAAEVALGCERIVEAEGEVLGYLRESDPASVAGLRERYDSMRARFARTAAEIRAELGD
jgi:regulator of RNase E activity RraA